MDVKLPNGVILQNVPEGTTKDAIASKAIKAGLITAQELFSPTEGMSGLDKFAAGAGKGLMDLAMGGGQALGLVDQQAIQEREARDAPLMASGAAQAGSFAGKVAAPVVAAMTAPGAATVGGGAAIGAGMGLLEPVAQGDVLTGKLTNTAVGGLLGGAGQKVGNIIGNKIGKHAAQRVAQAEALAVANATKDATTKAGQALGYTVPPTHANPTLTNRVLEGMAGKLTTGQLAAEKNQGITDLVAKRALGIADDSPLSLSAVEGVRKSAYGAYEALKAHPVPFKADAGFADDMVRLTQQNGMLAQEFPEFASKNVDEIVAAATKPEYSPAGTVELVKKLRSDAKTLFKSAAPDDLAAARTKRGIADALEGLIERNLAQSGDEALVNEFRAARELIAKTHTIEDALNEGTGRVVARKLAGHLAKGTPLKGELKDAAKFAQAYPKATQEVTSSMPGISPLDFYGSGAMALGTSNPLPLLYPAARMGIRSGLLSPGYQSLMTSPKYSAGGMEQILAGLLGSKGASGASAALGPLIYGSQQ